jgi:sugar/nucleoside kinase (ribokinase family)
METKRFDVAVVGNTGIDTSIYLPGADIDFNVEANFTQNLDTIGQAGGYACRGYARLGKKTTYIGAIGADYHGDTIRREFTKECIDTTGLFIDPQGTARSINFMYQDGRRKNFYDGKSHMTLQPDLETCRQVLAQARLAHFNLPNWARDLLPIAKELGLAIACDIQDVLHADDPYRQDFIQYADYLFFSAVNQDNPQAMIEAFIRRNPGLTVISGMGARGCALGTPHVVQFFDPLPMSEPVVDTNGAGDSLAVGFLSSYVLDGYSLAESVLRGQIAARHTCTLRGTSEGLINSERMESLFQRYTR